MGTFTISEILLEAFRRKGLEVIPIKIATVAEFICAIALAKKNNAYGPFVDKHSKPEYQKMKLFVTTDCTAGIAIEQDGNIVSVFNGGSRRGVLKILMPVAIANGGKKLDNFDGRLSTMYSLYGFQPVSKTRFNRNFAPCDWNYSRDGEPDIIFWLHNGDSAENVVMNFGAYSVDFNSVKEFESYEEAGRYRDSLIIDKKRK